MLTLTNIYMAATVLLWGYTVWQHGGVQGGYFSAILTYMSREVNVFLVYNMVVCVAILLYRVQVRVFLGRTLEGEVVKLTDRLKMKVLDIVFFSYVVHLQLDFQVYLVLVTLIFLFVLHTHTVLRAEFLVHVHSTSTALGAHYRLLGLFLGLLFLDYQVLKWTGVRMLMGNVESEVLFVYYMFSTGALLLEPFLQFLVDFYEKYTFTHLRRSDELLAKAALVVNVPRLVIQLLLSSWIAYKFEQPFFFVICGIDNFSQLWETCSSFSRIRKLNTSMAHLPKLAGDDLAEFHDLTCTVCYEDIAEAVLLPCRHIFHEECMRQWIVKNLNHYCPKCKREFNIENIQDEYHPPQEQQQQQQQDYEDLRALINNPQQRNQQTQQTHQTQQPQPIHQHPPMMQPEAEYPSHPDRHAPERRLEAEREHQSGQESPLSQFSFLNGKREAVPARHYIIDRPDLSEMPLEFYEATKRRIVPVGSLPFGLPTVAVANRTQLHMQKRREFGKELEVVLRLMSMNRNEQLLFL